MTHTQIIINLFKHSTNIIEITQTRFMTNYDNNCTATQYILKNHTNTSIQPTTVRPIHVNIPTFLNDQQQGNQTNTNPKEIATLQ